MSASCTDAQSLAALLALTAAFGCSSSDPATDGGDASAGAGTDTTSGAGGATESASGGSAAGHPGGAGGAGDAGGAGGAGELVRETVTLGKTATVKAHATWSSQGESHLAVFAAFQDAKDSEVTVSSLTVGDCEYRTVDFEGVDWAFVSAGTLSIIGGAEPYSLEPTNDQYFDVGPAPAATLMFEPGQTITIQFSGGAVEAFSETVDVPEGLVGISPPLDTLQTLDAAQDWTVSWLPLTGGSPVELHIANGEEVVHCTAGASSSEITVPAILLQQMTPGTVTLDLHQGPTVTSMHGDWTVATTVASGQSGASAEVVLE
jgi:hypothetical protein